MWISLVAFCLDYREYRGFYKGPFPSNPQWSAQSEQLWLSYVPASPHADARVRKDLLERGLGLIYLQWALYRVLPSAIAGALVGPLAYFAWRNTARGEKDGVNGSELDLV